MNLNDFVVLPNNKAKSVKLNARNLQELQMETVTLAQQSKEMEEKLQQLKESMSKEKEERGHSGRVRWKSGQCGSINSNALIKTLKHTVPKQLSAGKVKIRVLKDEPLTAPPQPSSPFPTGGLQTTRKNRLMGTHCGQCETKPAGLKDLQTHVSTPDVARCFQKQINLRSDPSTFSSPAVAKPMQLRPDPSQVFTVDPGEEKKVEVTEEGQKSSLLKGEYNEEEAARSFQEALRQWRGEKSDVSEAPEDEDPMWTPIRPASVSAMATQADLSPDRGAEGRGRGGRGPVRVEFTENSLTYVDRLLLKKHSRTPLQTYCPPLAFGTDLKSLPDTKTGKETASSLTAREEELRRYCASLFAVPDGRGGTEPQLTTPESCLVIEVMDERDRDMNGVLAAEQRPDNNRKVPTAQQIHRKGTAVPQTASSTRGSSRVSCSSPSLAQPSKPSKPKDSQKLHHSKPQSSKEEHSTKSSSSKCKPSACLTAKTPRTTKTLIKTPTSMSPKPNWTPNFHKSNPDPGSIQLLSSPSQAHSQTEIPRSSYSPVAFPPDVSPSASPGPTLPAEHLSPSIPYSLWSTFTLSPSRSTEGTLLPNVYPSDPLQRGSDSSLLSEQPIFKDSSVFMSSSPIPAEHEFTHCMYPPLDVRGEKEEELSIDSGDEMSTDSLGPASHEEDSSDEEAPMNGRLTRGRSSDERGNPAISHTQDPFVPADADREEDLQSDEQEQLSEASMVVHNQRAGPGSEKFCDLDGFPPLGLDVNHGHSDTPEHTRRDPLHTCQTSTHGSDPTEGYGLSSSSSLSTYTEEHLFFRMMKNNHMQPTEIQIHSTRPTRRDEISADELGTSGPGSSKSTLHPGDGGSPDQHEDRGFTRDRADEEAAAQGDRQSVRLLP